ncbi:MAG: hypothetical protein PUJ11_07885 [Eubacteriaceae bacterium]|nr:hypothetical protein [Eubacteriaceae bacterium]
MITLMTIGIIVLSIKLIIIAFKAAWGITKAVLFVAFLPLILIGMLVAGLAALAAPVLIIGLIGAFLIPRVCD